MSSSGHVVQHALVSLLCWHAGGERGAAQLHVFRGQKLQALCFAHQRQSAALCWWRPAWRHPHAASGEWPAPKLGPAPSSFWPGVGP